MLRNVFSFIAVTAFIAVAQTINLQGVVSDSDGEPISDATVSLVLRDMEDITGADGKFSLIGGTSVKKVSAIVPQSDKITLNNSVVQFSLSSRSAVKVELFDLKGKLLWREVNMNAAAGMYRFDISKSCRAANVLVVKASIGKSEVSFRFMDVKGGLHAVTPLNNTSAIFERSGLTAVTEVVDTLKVTATGYQSKSVELTSLENEEQNITLDAEVVVKEWPTADPTAPGPFEVTVEKNVGPLAGIADDPIYGEQKRFNVYYPRNLATSGYIHPIIIWANGYKDNPEENPPKCVIDHSNQWCGQYLPIIEHLASHGFFVVAPLSTATGSGDPLPTIVGLDWIIEQNEDSGSPYYHCLDTSRIGQIGHSFGGMSTCLSASDPRYKALATICGTTTLSGVHTPMLFYCGGKDNTVSCSGVKNTFLTVTDQPSFFINEHNSDHGWWVYQGPDGVSLSSAAAWFRVHLMNDTANRKFFYGSDCTFCKDSRVEVEQNSLMTD